MCRTHDKLCFQLSSSQSIFFGMLAIISRSQMGCSEYRADRKRSDALLQNRFAILCQPWNNRSFTQEVLAVQVESSANEDRERFILS